MTRTVVWSKSSLDKLGSFRSRHFTPDESYDFIAQIILEAEDLLGNSALTKTYTEELGRYKRLSRVVIRRFKIYYKKYRQSHHY